MTWDIIIQKNELDTRMVGWIVFALFILFLFWMIYLYNSLVALTNDVKNAFTQIDVQLKRRHDLIPNLVSVVKGYMDYERDTLERVTSARARALSAAGMHARAAAEDTLTHALNGLFAVIENYPVLKSSENVLQLQEELSSTENRIAFSRQLYNDLVANLATQMERFPNSVIAGLFSFKKAEYFTAEETDRSLPRVDSDTGDR
jgi:LemA protein